MNLNDFASELVAGKKFVKAAFSGFAGGGKSRTASEFVIGAYHALGCTKPAMIIDNENGSRFLVPLFRNAGIKALLKQTTSLEDVLAAIDFLNKGEIDFLFADSLTKVWYRYIRDYLAKNRKVFMGLDDWGKVLPKWQESFSDVFVAAQGSIVFTGRGGFEYTKEDDEYDEETGRKKKGGYVKSGVKMKMAGETPFEPDLNVWMEREEEITSSGIRVWREALIMKDRSGLIDGKTFVNPTFADFQPFIGYIVDEPTGAVAGETYSRNLAPGENYDSYARKTSKQIALEEIQEEIVKLHPGQTKDDKTSKANLLEELFSTRSWTAVENLSLEKLTEARSALWIKSRGHAYGIDPADSQPAELTLEGDDKIPHEAPTDVTPSNAVDSSATATPSAPEATEDMRNAPHITEEKAA